MTEKEARDEFRKIIRERNKEMDNIIAKTISHNNFLCGLDSNKALYAEIDAKYKTKIEELKLKIDKTNRP